MWCWYLVLNLVSICINSICRVRKTYVFVKYLHFLLVINCQLPGKLYLAPFPRYSKVENDPTLI